MQPPSPPRPGTAPALAAVAILLVAGLAGLTVAEAQVPPGTSGLVRFGPPWDPSPEFGMVGDPAFHEYKGPATLDGVDEAGGPTIGISGLTDNVMFKSNRNTYRVVFNDTMMPPRALWSDATPPASVDQAGGAAWADASPGNLNAFLHTDNMTGRTWSGGLLGYCSSMHFSDNDGQNWYPMATPCTGSQGYDHQSLASGPYGQDLVSVIGGEVVITDSAGGETVVNPNRKAVYPQAVYYCAGQDTLTRNYPFPIRSRERVNEGVTVDNPVGGPGDTIDSFWNQIFNNPAMPDQVPNPPISPGGLVDSVWPDSVTVDGGNPANSPPIVIGDPTLGWMGPGYSPVMHAPSYSCSMSHDGGVTFGPAAPVEDLSNSLFGPMCTGRMGHPKVGPFGAVVIPAQNCYNGQLQGNATAILVSQDNARTWSLRYLPCIQLDQDGVPVHPQCGTGRFDPSVGISRESGWLYVAQAEDAGIWVAHSRDNGTTWRSLGDGNAADPIGLGPDFMNSTYLDLGQLKIQCDVCKVPPRPVMHAAFADVVVGDDLRAAVSFLGSEQQGLPGSPFHPNGCGAQADVHRWNYYVAMTFDGGENWTAKRLTDDPVHIGGIWAGGAIHHESAPNRPACRNLLEFNDMVMDSKGRIHIAFADGCLSGCMDGAASTSAWATILRQSTGCGLFAEHDLPFPNACDIYMSDGWATTERPAVDGVEPSVGNLTIQSPLSGQAFWRTEGMQISGQVAMARILPPLMLNLSVPQQVVAGERSQMQAAVAGGSNSYACLWSSREPARITDSVNCDGTGLYINQTGTFRFDFHAFDVLDPSRNVQRSFTIQATTDASAGDCRQDPQVRDPSYDVAPWMFVQGDRSLEGANRDIEAVCVNPMRPGAEGDFEVVLKVRDLLPRYAGSVRVDDERRTNYGVAFCTDNNPEEVCYAALTTVGPDGNRSFDAGLVHPGDTRNPARLLLNDALCPVPGLLKTGGTGIDVQNDTVRFRFDRAAFNVTTPVGPGAQGCGTVGFPMRDGVGLHDGTVLDRLTGGTAMMAFAAGLESVVDEDVTHPTTGRRDAFQFQPLDIPSLEVDARGLWQAEPGDILTVTPRLAGVMDEAECRWRTPMDATSEELKNVQFAAASVIPRDSCGAVQISFDKPGLYIVKLEAKDVLGKSRPPQTISEGHDYTLFYIGGSTAGRLERVHITINDDDVVTVDGVDGTRWDPCDAETKQAPRAGTPVDTRFQNVRSWSVQVNLLEYNVCWDPVNMMHVTVPRFPSLLVPEKDPPTMHQVRAQWIGHNGTVLDTATVGFMISYPPSLAPVLRPPPVRALPMDGIDLGRGLVDSSGDGIPDRFDNCPMLFNPDQADTDGNGVGDACDPDIDGDGVANELDNCAFAFNPGQADTSGNGVGDACTNDIDGDGVTDDVDNCPYTYNPGQEDSNGNGVGDACDPEFAIQSVLERFATAERGPPEPRHVSPDDGSRLLVRDLESAKVAGGAVVVSILLLLGLTAIGLLSWLLAPRRED